MRQESKKMSYTIAYVMSLPHSGSTLCGSLLGGHSQAFCLGEPWKLGQYARLERKTTHKTALGNSCTCGAPDIWACTFWPKVDSEVYQKSGLSLRDLDTASSDPERFKRDNKLMYDAVAAVTGASLLVDSSKRVERLQQLVASDFAPIKIVHLLRSPRGQVLSNMKRTGRGPYRHAVRNAIETMRMILAGRSSQAVSTRYEDMAANAENWLTELMPEFGLEFESEQLNWANLERHNISGNLSRATKDNTIKVDRSWETGLKPLHKIYVDIIAGPFSKMANSPRRTAHAGKAFSSVFAVSAGLSMLLLGSCAVKADADASKEGLSSLNITPGGEKGRTVAVTNLADDGPGSLRYAISQSGPRNIIFKVGGEIWLKSDLVIREPFVTIAGETAPSPGISVMGDSVRVRGHDVILRHIRVRVGALGSGSPAENRDGIGIDGSQDGTRPAHNILVENCSVAWSIDEGVTIYGPNTNNIVIRNTIVAEGLLNSIHPKGPHSMGLLVGPLTRDVLVQGNILASNRWRNPVVSAGASAIIVNNLIYNPGGFGLHYYSRRNMVPTRVTAVGNLVIAGPDTKPSLLSFKQALSPGSQLNYRDNRAEGTQAFDRNEVMADGQAAPFVEKPPIWRSDLDPLPVGRVRMATLQHAGARPWDRDATDARIIAEIQNGGGHIPDQPADQRLRASEAALAEKADAKAARKRCKMDPADC
jgi:Sulfotransferase family/Right handed beta helix region